MPLKIKPDEQPSINLTPMIDIVFLLLIFFMVGSRFSDIQQQERDISLKVPQVKNAKALTASPSKRVINVFHDGKIMLDQQPVTLTELEERLAAARLQYQKLGVVVRGDRNSPFDHVAQVLNTCERVKIGDINIAVTSSTVTR